MTVLRVKRINADDRMSLTTRWNWKRLHWHKEVYFQDYKTNYDSHTEIDKSYFDYVIRGYRDY